MPHHFGKKRKHGDGERLQRERNKFSDSLKGLPKVKPFDICLSGSRSGAKYTGSLNGKNRENWNEMGHIKVEGTKQRILRPGMVLLKQYITLSKQVAKFLKIEYYMYSLMLQILVKHNRFKLRWQLAN